MSGNRQEKIHHSLELRALDVKNVVRKVKQSERREGPDETKHGGDSQEPVRMFQTSGLFR